MRQFRNSLMRRFLKNERGQAAIIAIFSTGTMMALAGASVETGHVYYAYQQLVASTDAAVMAGAQAMPNTSQASSYVTQYSAESGQLNANPMLMNVTATPTFLCLNTVSTTFQIGCQTSTGGTGGYNALSVTQTATVKLWLGGLVGMSQMNIEATATAAMRGGGNAPWNIAIVMDTTASMGDSDSGLQCSGTQESCALQGAQMLLNDLYPCALGATCTTTPNPPPAVDSVSLFVFPPVTTATASKDYVCKTSDPTIVAYTFPDPPTNVTLPSGDTYQVVTWSSNYKVDDSAASLNGGSPLAIAVGDSGVTGCSGLQTPGGDGTYYAQVIYAAQAALAAQQTANPGSSNAMIILTDGDATACASNANTSAGACSSKADMVASEGTLNGTGTSKTNPMQTLDGVQVGYESYAYPSALGECGQAVLAAQAAAKAGTIVYTIGYGAETSGGCTTDKTYSATVTTEGGSWSPGKQPCQAIAAMASSELNFYSDDGDGCQATAPSNQSITQLTAIFRAIADNMSSPRLIPNGTT